MNSVVVPGKSKLRKSLLGIFVLLLSFIFILAPKAYAIASIAVSPSGGPPLSTAQIIGQGFCASCGTVSVGMNSSIIVYNIPVDSVGRFSASFEIPDMERPGPNTVFANQDTKSTYRIYAVTNFNVVINPNQNGTPNQAVPNLPPQLTPKTSVKNPVFSSKNNLVVTSLSRSWLSRNKLSSAIIVILVLVVLWQLQRIRKFADTQKRFKK